MSDVSSSAPASSTPVVDSKTSTDNVKSSPSVNGGYSKSDGVPSVESVTGGSVKPEKSSAEPKQESKDGSEPVADKAERKAEEARIKAKVNGKEREYTLEEARRRLELIDGADEKFQSAAQMRKQVDQFLEALRTNPMKVLTNPELGINFRQLAEEYLGAEVRKEMMDPQQRELEELRAWKQEQEAARQEQETQTKQTAEQKRYEAAKQQKIQEYDQKIAKVLASAQLPKTPHTVKRVAEVLHSAMKKGYELDLETAVDFVREGYMSDIQSMFGGLEGEALEKVLGDGISKKFRKYDIERLKSKLNPSVPAQPQQQQSNESAPSQPRQQKSDKQFMTQAEWLDAMRKKAGV